METPGEKRMETSENASTKTEPPSKKRRRTCPDDHRKINLNDRLEIARDFAANPEMSASTLAHKWLISTNQARHIAKNADQLLRLVQVIDCPAGARKINSSKRHFILDLAEPRLAYWIAEQNSKGFPVSLSRDVTSKILWLCETIGQQVKNVDSTHELGIFKASNGWYDKFRERFELGRTRYLPDGDKPGAIDANSYAEQHWKLRKDIQEYQLCQVYSGDETGLNWQLSADRKASMKRRCTLFLASNATGNHRLKPYLLFDSSQPKNIPIRSDARANLPVIYVHQNNSQMDLHRFRDYLKHYFIPAARRFQTERRIPIPKQKALLLVDSAPAHKKLLAIEPSLIDGSGFLKVEFLHPGLTSSLQPINQTIYRTFKASYLLQMLQKAKLKVSKLEGKDLLVNFKRAFTIRDAIDLIDEAWRQLPASLLKSSWAELVDQKAQPNSPVKSFQPDPELCALANEFGVNIDTFVSELDDEDLTDIQTLSEPEVREIQNMAGMVHRNTGLFCETSSVKKQKKSSTKKSKANGKLSNSISLMSSTSGLENSGENSTNSNSNVFVNPDTLPILQNTLDLPSNSQPELSENEINLASFLQVSLSETPEVGESSTNLTNSELEVHKTNSDSANQEILNSLSNKLINSGMKSGNITTGTIDSDKSQVCKSSRNLIKSEPEDGVSSTNSEPEVSELIQLSTKSNSSELEVSQQNSTDADMKNENGNESLEQAKSRSHDLLKQLFDMTNDLAEFQEVNRFLEQRIETLTKSKKQIQ